MLLSAVFTLRSQQAASLRVDQGRAVHGLFLDWLRQEIGRASCRERV